MGWCFATHPKAVEEGLLEQRPLAMLPDGLRSIDVPEAFGDILADKAGLAVRQDDSAHVGAIEVVAGDVAHD